MADFCKAAAVHRHTHDAERDADECVWCSSDLARARGTATVVLDDDELLADPELDPDENGRRCNPRGTRGEQGRSGRAEPDPVEESLPGPA
jgi:hypothetical protein